MNKQHLNNLQAMADTANVYRSLCDSPVRTTVEASPSDGLYRVITTAPGQQVDYKVMDYNQAFDFVHDQLKGAQERFEQDHDPA